MMAASDSSPMKTSSSSSSAKKRQQVAVMNPEERDNKIFWPAQLYIFVYYLLPLILEIVIYLGDILTDVIVAALMFSHGLAFPGIVTVAIIYLPPLVALVGIVVKLCSKKSDDAGKTIKEACIYVVLLFLFPVWPLFRYIRLIPYAWNAFWTREEREENLQFLSEQTEVNKYRFYQAFLQAAPQFLYQMFLILLESPDRQNFYLVVPQVYCILFSAISMTLVTIKYQNRPPPLPKLRKVRRSRSTASDRAASARAASAEDAENGATERDPALAVNNPGGVIEEDIIEITPDSDNMATSLIAFFGWLFLIGGRVFALALFASKFYYFFYLLAFLHVAIFTGFYIVKNNVGCDPGKLAAIVFAGFVLLFCVANYHIQFNAEMGVKPTVFAILYFGLTLLENIAIVIGWYVATTSQLWYHDVGLGFSLACYIFGIVMLLLARWMRVSGDAELLEDGGEEFKSLNQRADESVSATKDEQTDAAR